MGLVMINLPPSIVDDDGDAVTESVDLMTTAPFATFDSQQRVISLLLDENVCPGEYQFTVILSDGMDETEYPVVITVNDLG